MCMCVYLKLPEDAARVSVIVLPQRDELHSAVASSQVALHVLKEPGFEVQANSVDLLSRRKIRHQTRSKKGWRTCRCQRLTLSGSAWSVMVPVMTTAESRLYWMPSTNVFRLSADASAKRRLMFSRPLTGS